MLWDTLVRCHHYLGFKQTAGRAPDDLQAFDWEAFPPEHTTLDKGHGRIEQRSLRTTTALNAHLDFAHAGQACRIERRVTNTGTGETHTERVFCITDLSPEQAAPERLLALDRGHWSIENRLHWVRDVIFDEDRCQVRKGHGPQVLACLRSAVTSSACCAA